MDRRREREWDRNKLRADKDRDRDRDRDSVARNNRNNHRDRSRSPRQYREPRDNRTDGDHHDRNRSARDQQDIIRVDRKDLADAQSRYYGTKQERKERRKGNRKFVFDWDKHDDTSVQTNYVERHEPTFFGRGKLAGIDLREQRLKQAKYFKELKDKQKKLEQELSETHWADKALQDMTERDWRIFREDFQIAVKGGRVANPLRRWSESNLPPEICKIIDKCGYKEPTPIQRQAIPIGLQCRDIIGVAETGSGKTLAFLLPLMIWIVSLPKEQRVADEELGPFALILAPTRELAQQIEEETLKFAKPLNIRTTLIIGGVSKEVQGVSLRSGVEIVIATPGRLIDVIETRYLVLSRCTYVVLDEADKMIDMGFEPEVKKILDFMPVSNTKPDSDAAEDETMLKHNWASTEKFRQTVMFTATMPPSVERLAQTYLRRPAIVYIGSIGKPVETVRQRVFYISEAAKRNKLMDILNSEHLEPPVIVFVNQKRAADMLAKTLEREGWHACALHGGKDQDTRDSAMSNIKTKSKDILVATDVASRGIDIKDVSLVINYDMSKTIEAYTHRIGRTGRAGKKGEAITFLTKEDSHLFYDLKQLLLTSSNVQMPSEFANHPDANTKPGTISQKRPAFKDGPGGSKGSGYR